MSTNGRNRRVLSTHGKDDQNFLKLKIPHTIQNVVCNVVSTKPAFWKCWHLKHCWAEQFNCCFLFKIIVTYNKMCIRDSVQDGVYTRPRSSSRCVGAPIHTILHTQTRFSEQSLENMSAEQPKADKTFFRVSASGLQQVAVTTLLSLPQLGAVFLFIMRSLREWGLFEY